jgi:hypothetical protein
LCSVGHCAEGNTVSSGDRRVGIMSGGLKGLLRATAL